MELRFLELKMELESRHGGWKFEYFELFNLISLSFIPYKSLSLSHMQGGSGSASDIKFRNIEMENVTNPIIINQNYCDKKKKPCKKGVNTNNFSYYLNQQTSYHYWLFIYLVVAFAEIRGPN